MQTSSAGQKAKMKGKSHKNFDDDWGHETQVQGSNKRDKRSKRQNKRDPEMA